MNFWCCTGCAREISWPTTAVCSDFLVLLSQCGCYFRSEDALMVDGQNVAAYIRWKAKDQMNKLAKKSADLC